MLAGLSISLLQKAIFAIVTVQFTVHLPLIAQVAKTNEQFIN